MHSIYQFTENAKSLKKVQLSKIAIELYILKRKIIVLYILIKSKYIKLTLKGGWHNLRKSLYI